MGKRPSYITDFFPPTQRLVSGAGVGNNSSTSGIFAGDSRMGRASLPLATPSLFGGQQSVNNGYRSQTVNGKRAMPAFLVKAEGRHGLVSTDRGRTNVANIYPLWPRRAEIDDPGFWASLFPKNHTPAPFNEWRMPPAYFPGQNFQASLDGNFSVPLGTLSRSEELFFPEGVAALVTDFDLNPLYLQEGPIEELIVENSPRYVSYAPNDYEAGPPRTGMLYYKSVYEDLYVLVSRTGSALYQLGNRTTIQINRLVIDLQNGTDSYPMVNHVSIYEQGSIITYSAITQGAAGSNPVPLMYRTNPVDEVYNAYWWDWPVGAMLGYGMTIRYPDAMTFYLSCAQNDYAPVSVTYPFVGSFSGSNGEDGLYYNDYVAIPFNGEIYKSYGELRMVLV